MDQQKIYARALQVMEENFNHVVEMSVASAANDEVAARDLNAYYHAGKFYVLGKRGNTLLEHIAKCPHVGLCHGSHNMQGTAVNLGHPLDPQNAALRKILKKEFALNYSDYVTETNPDMCIVEITLTKAETYTRYHRYEINFVAQIAERDHTIPLFLYR